MHEKQEEEFVLYDGSPAWDSLLILHADGFTEDGIHVSLLSDEEKLAFMKRKVGEDYE